MGLQLPILWTLIFMDFPFPDSSGASCALVMSRNCKQSMKNPKSTASCGLWWPLQSSKQISIIANGIKVERNMDLKWRTYLRKTQADEYPSQESQDQWGPPLLPTRFCTLLLFSLLFSLHSPEKCLLPFSVLLSFLLLVPLFFAAWNLLSFLVVYGLYLSSPCSLSPFQKE